MQQRLIKLIVLNFVFMSANNETTVVKINQNNNNIMNTLNTGNHDKVDINQIKEVPTAKNSKSCCGKCLKYVACPLFVAYLLTDVVYNKYSNIENVLRCNDLKSFSDDISGLFTNKTINSLMTNYTSNTSKAALEKFYNAYKKVESKYPFINLNSSDIEKTLAFVNNVLFDFAAVEKISKTCEEYFKNTTELIQAKTSKYIDKYKKYFEKGKETVNNITNDVEEFNTKAVDYKNKYQNYLQVGSKAIDNINTNLQTLQQLQDKFKDGNIYALIPHVKEIFHVIDNLENSVKDIHNITLNVQNDLVTDKNEIDVYIQKLSTHKNNVQHIADNLQQDAKNDIQEVKSLTTNIKQTGEDILRESENLLARIKNDITESKTIINNAKNVAKALSALDYEGDKCKTFLNKDGSINYKEVLHGVYHGMDSLKPTKQKIS